MKAFACAAASAAMALPGTAWAKPPRHIPSHQSAACSSIVQQYVTANDAASRYMALAAHMDGADVQAKEANAISRVRLFLEQGKAVGCKMPAVAPKPDRYDMEARGCAVGAIMARAGSGAGYCDPDGWKGERAAK